MIAMTTLVGTARRRRVSERRGIKRRRKVTNIVINIEAIEIAVAIEGVRGLNHRLF